VKNERAVVAAMAVMAGVALLLILALAVASSGDQLVGTSWRATSIVVDGANTPVLDGSTVTAIFDDTTMRGFGGCNSMSAGYEVSGSSLIFGQVLSTMAFCDDPVGVFDQEVAVVSLLASVDEFSINGDQLVLLADGRPVITMIADQVS